MAEANGILAELKAGFFHWAATGPDGSPDGARLAVIFGGLVLAVLSAVGAWLYYRYRREREEGELRVRPAAEAAGLAYAFRDPGLRKELGLRFGLGYEWQRYVLRGTVGGLRCAAYENVYRSKYFDLLNFFVCFRPDLPELPEIDVKPRSLATRDIFNSGGLRHVELQTVPGFTDEYEVRAAGEDTARRVLTQSAADFLRARPGWALEARGGWIRVRVGKEGGMAPETLKSVVAEAASLAGLVAGAAGPR